MNTSGLCQCGCGGNAPIADRSYLARGIVKGEPFRYIAHHHIAPPVTRPEPNPEGLCKCGCGEPTALAPYGRPARGWVPGKPMNYVPGHQSRKTPIQYVVNDATGCWEWQWYRDVNGYGIIRNGGKTAYAHRVFYERQFGQIAKGLDLDHECLNPGCVNPDHLNLLTKAEHVLLSMKRGQIKARVRRQGKKQTEPTE